MVYSYGENSLKMLEHGRKLARRSLEAAGAVEILDSRPVTPAYHLMERREWAQIRGGLW